MNIDPKMSIEAFAEKLAAEAAGREKSAGIGTLAAAGLKATSAGTRTALLALGTSAAAAARANPIGAGAAVGALGGAALGLPEYFAQPKSRRSLRALLPYAVTGGLAGAAIGAVPAVKGLTADVKATREQQARQDELNALLEARQARAAKIQVQSMQEYLDSQKDPVVQSVSRVMPSDLKPSTVVAGTVGGGAGYLSGKGPLPSTFSRIGEAYQLLRNPAAPLRQLGDLPLIPASAAPDLRAPLDRAFTALSEGGAKGLRLVANVDDDLTRWLTQQYRATMRDMGLTKRPRSFDELVRRVAVAGRSRLSPTPAMAELKSILGFIQSGRGKGGLSLGMIPGNQGIRNFVAAGLEPTKRWFTESLDSLAAKAKPLASATPIKSLGEVFLPGRSAGFMRGIREIIRENGLNSRGIVSRALRLPPRSPVMTPNTVNRIAAMGATDVERAALRELASNAHNNPLLTRAGIRTATRAAGATAAKSAPPATAVGSLKRTGAGVAGGVALDALARYLIPRFDR